MIIIIKKKGYDYIIMEHTKLVSHKSLIEAIENNNIDLMNEIGDTVIISVTDKEMMNAIKKHYTNDVISFLRKKNPLLDSYLKIKYKNR